MANHIEFTTEGSEIPNNRRLDSLLANKTERSRSFVKGLIQESHVRVNSKVTTKVSQPIQIGDHIQVTLIEGLPKAKLTPIAGELDILFEDEHLLFVAKPQGLVVHPAPTYHGDTLVHYLLHHLKTHSEFGGLSPVRPGIVHRLDRGTSGVMLVGKHRESQERLSHLFSTRQIRKTYEALVWGSPPKEGSSSLPIGRHPVNRMKMSSKGKGLRAATTRWVNQTEFKHFSHLLLYPQSGRTHQLRVHLSESGYPICGDLIYGGRHSSQRRELHADVRAVLEASRYPYLHARELSFNHPFTNCLLKIEAPLPGAFNRFLKILSLWESDAGASN